MARVPGVAFGFPFPLSTLLGRVESVFAAEYDARVKGAGMDGMTLSLGTNVIRHLDGDHGVRLGTLAEKAGVTKQAISQQVAHLATHGYVQVEPHPADNRAKVVRLTDKGRRSQQIGRPLFAELERDWHRRFGREEVQELRRILESMLDTMDDTEVVPRTRRSGRPESP